MSIADMEIPAPDPVLKAMAKRVEHGIFGYTMAGDAYFEAVAAWQMERHHHAISPEWVVTHHGVLPSLFQMIRAFLPPNSGVVVMTPLSRPFSMPSPSTATVSSPVDCVRHGDSYAIDFEAFEDPCRDQATRLFILCNPHNPTGRNFTADELHTLRRSPLDTR